MIDRPLEHHAFVRASALALVLFVLVGLLVFHGPGNELDLWLTQQVAAERTPFLTALLSAASFVGNTRTLVGLSLLLLAAATLHRPLRRESLHVVTLLIAVGVVSPLLKHAYSRPRPPASVALQHETSFSFPSGHAMASICLFGFVAYLATTYLDGWQRRGVVGLSVALIATIGFSRVYLGVHYPCDVLAGYLAGAPLLAFTVLAHRRPTR